MALLFVLYSFDFSNCTIDNASKASFTCADCNTTRYLGSNAAVTDDIISRAKPSRNVPNS